MSNETLVLKSKASSASALSLTDLPIKSGEILELACKLFANGATDESHVIKVLEGTAKYNTETPLSAYYALVFRDGGFYVGPRSTADDLEPKEGDWWPYSITSIFRQAGWNASPIYVIKGATDHFMALREDGSAVAPCIAKNNYTNPVLVTGAYNRQLEWKWLPVANSANSADTAFLHGDSRYSWVDGDNKTTKYKLMAFKTITASDILAYTNTGALGKLFFSNSAITSGTTVDSLTLCATAPISVDGTTAETTQVGSLYITTSAVSGEVTSDGEIYEVYKSNL